MVLYLQSMVITMSKTRESKFRIFDVSTPLRIEVAEEFIQDYLDDGWEVNFIVPLSRGKMFSVELQREKEVDNDE